MRYVILATFVIFMAACSSKPACHNTDLVFDQYGPTDQSYKAALITRIHQTDPKRVHYYVDNYKEINGKPFIIINVQGDSFCAKMQIDIKNPNKLRDFKNVKGISYSSEEIKGFQYHTDTVEGEYKFVFEEGNIKGKKQ
jgi:hypothetical protein